MKMKLMKRKEFALDGADSFLFLLNSLYDIKYLSDKESVFF